MPRTLPILDLSSWREGDRASLARIGAEVGAACRDVGFFYVVNHGVDRELIERAFAQSHRFFALPLAERQALAIETIGGNRGYSGMLHEALDPGRGPDMKEAFNVGLEIAPDDPDLSLIGGYPISKMSLARKLLRDASGISYFKFIKYFIYFYDFSFGEGGG